MKRLLFVIALVILLSSYCLGMTEQEAINIVVNDLRVQLMQSEFWIDWDRLYEESYFRVNELKPYTWYF